MTLQRPWRVPPDQTELTLTYQCTGTPTAPVLSVSLDGACYCLDDPIQLEPVTVAKPWGREIWFSGIEARGESRVVSGGSSLGLGSYLALAPERICRRQPLILLKMLDPRPEPVLGELYLEVHEEKREVYVVTAIDPDAWPSGNGQIRFGVNQQKRQEFDSDTSFREAFLAALQRYERARAAIDSGRTDLASEEQAARRATLDFTASQEITVGDVISIPTWVPHSLQPGVRVIEFQTPNYERYILSSSQQVLTQQGWDSAVAVSRMSLEPPAPFAPEPVAAGVDRVVEFEDFSVWRAALSAGDQLALPQAAPYAIAYCVSGALTLAGSAASLTLEAGQAALIPALAIGKPIVCSTPGLALFAGPAL